MGEFNWQCTLCLFDVLPSLDVYECSINDSALNSTSIRLIVCYQPAVTDILSVPFSGLRLFNDFNHNVQGFAQIHCMIYHTGSFIVIKQILFLLYLNMGEACLYCIIYPWF